LPPSPLAAGDDKVDEADRKGYRDEVLSLAGMLAADDDPEKVVWEVYAGTERLIAILKFRLDYETPGVFTRLPDASDPAKLLAAARESLLKAADEISKGRMVGSIGTLRKARNGLRSYLTAKRKSVIKSQKSPGRRSEPST
jgi:hypothetical protein